MYHKHSPLFPETPRLQSVALPDDCREDAVFLSQAYRPTLAPVEGNTLGLLGMIASTAGPFMKDIKRRFQAFSIDVSPGKKSRAHSSSSSREPPMSPTSPTYPYSRSTR